MINRRRNWIQKSIRDYIVPIIGALLIFILIFSFFSWDSSSAPNDTENKIWLSLLLAWNNSSATIVYPWDYKADVEESTSLYKWEKIIVKEWSVSIDYPSIANFNVNKLWELKYLENGNFSFYSWELWIDSIWSVDVDMKYAKINVWENSHLSISQNEMESTVYLVSGFAEVSNLVWQSTVLAPNQKLTISRIQASSDDLNLSIAKEELDEFFLMWDWFIKNNGNFFLSNKEKDNEEEEDKEKSISNNNSNKKWFISFDVLDDESNVSSSSTKITWKILNSEVTKIVLNWEEAKINSEAKVFTFENIDTSSAENDLVFRVYDDANDILEKFVYTVFYDQAVVSNNNNWWFNVKTYDVDGTKFTFTAPTTKNTYTTYETFVTIRWKVLTDWIDKVTVNDYKLNSFNGSTWRYHADSKFNNLNEWTNIYQIKYFTGGKLAYTNNFTIIKKIAQKTTKPIEKETKKISGES